MAYESGFRFRGYEMLQDKWRKTCAKVHKTFDCDIFDPRIYLWVYATEMNVGFQVMRVILN
jgi:hypothetical protein